MLHGTDAGDPCETVRSVPRAEVDSLRKAFPGGMPKWVWRHIDPRLTKSQTRRGKDVITTG